MPADNVNRQATIGEDATMPERTVTKPKRSRAKPAIREDLLYGRCEQRCTVAGVANQRCEKQGSLLLVSGGVAPVQVKLCHIHRKALDETKYHVRLLTEIEAKAGA